MSITPAIAGWNDRFTIVLRNSALQKEYPSSSPPPLSSGGVLVRALSSSVAGSEREEAGENEEDVVLKRRPRRSQRWQWSKGDGPGEYGGPPLDFRIRRMWGRPIEDPIASTDDYIWKKNWQSHPSTSSSTPSPPPSQAASADVGFLSLNRAIALDSIDVDLSRELTKPGKSVLALQVEAARDGLPTDEAIKQDKVRWRLAPTRGEQKQWARARKGTGMAMLVTEAGDGENLPKARSPTSKLDYMQLKGNLYLLTGLFGGAGVVLAYTLYSPEVSMSYGIGLLGALAYIRMLGNSVDSLAQTDSNGAIRGALGQPRLLVPVLLVMFYNRWNEVLAPQSGFPQLQLIPMLVGLFTYKAATIVEVFRDILQVSSEESVQ